MQNECAPYVGGSGLTQVTPMPLTPAQAQAYQTLKRQKRVTSWPYYSKIKFVAPTADAAPGPFTYSLLRGTQIRAFSYEVNGPKTSAGFTAADGNATISDTNIISRNQTTGGQNVLIHGIALQLLPASLHQNDGASATVNRRVRLADASFTAALWEDVSVEIALNGDENRFRLGTMGMLPGGGGLSGGSSDIAGINVLGTTGKDKDFATNGWAVKSNFFRVPEGLIWRNQSNSDSNLNLIFTVQNNIDIFSGGAPENNVAGRGANVAASATEAGYAYPTELCASVMVYMVGEVIGPRTRSA